MTTAATYINMAVCIYLWANIVSRRRLKTAELFTLVILFITCQIILWILPLF